MAYPRTYSAPTAEPVTVAEAKVHLKEDLSDSANDTYIGVLIQTAREACEHRISRSLMPQTWQVDLDTFPQAIRLDYAPVLSVVTVDYREQITGDWVTLSADAYQVDTASEPAWIVPAYGYTWPPVHAVANAVRVRYVAGYSNSGNATTDRAAVPAAARHWILLAVGDMYANRQSSNSRPAVPQDFADRLLDRLRVYG